jgi:rhodanese-related sulfurtransferase
MMAPFFKYGLFGEELSLIVAFVTGIGFGFFLERAGFGNARLLAAQFYFRDLRVLKVMFTAIVTAMVGLFVLARVGLVDLSLVYLTPTFLVPQVVGGLILGVGFIIGGYCPGTSCVSAATGRIDGMVYLAGMVGGLLGFAELYPHIAGFARSTGMGTLTLSSYFNIPYGVIVLAVVLMALGAFVAAEWAEKVVGGMEPGKGSLLEPKAGLTPIRAGAMLLVLLALFAAVAGSPYQGNVAKVDAAQLSLDAASPADQVSPTELADWLIEGRADFLLIDVREPSEFATYHIPGAINVPLAGLKAEFAARNERIVVCGSGELKAAQAWLLLRSLGFRGAHLLRGGVEEWNRQVLFPAAPAAGASVKETIEFAKRSAVARHFGGTPQGASGPSPAPAQTAPKLLPPPAVEPTPVVPSSTPRKKKEGC